MPELPEVETVVRALRRAIIGARIVRILHASRRVAAANPRGWRNNLEGRILEEVSRRGKYIVIKLSGGVSLVAHLRMTGRFRLQTPDTKRSAHDRFIAEIVIGESGKLRRLVLVDTRQFARIDWCTNGALRAHPGLSKLGPEADLVTEAQIRRVLSRSHRPIKSLLLDQTALAGLGNIYADESLFLASIHPLRSSNSLDRGEMRRLRNSIRRVLDAATKASGTTFDTFSDLEGNSGGFAPSLNVYQRAGQPCKECGAAIERLVLSGRSAHFCPNCQPTRLFTVWDHSHTSPPHIIARRIITLT